METKTAQHNVDLYMNWCLLKGHFSQQMAIAEENWSFNRWKQKQVKFDLGNVSKTNDADLGSFSLDQSGVRMSPLYGAFNRLIGPGGGGISHLLTLGNC